MSFGNGNQRDRNLVLSASRSRGASLLQVFLIIAAIGIVAAVVVSKLLS